jgi:hypothetical protein
VSDMLPYGNVDYQGAHIPVDLILSG